MAATASLSVGLVFGVVTNYDVPVASPQILLTTGEEGAGDNNADGAGGGTTNNNTDAGTTDTTDTTDTGGPRILKSIQQAITSFFSPGTVASGSTRTNRPVAIFGDGRAQRNSFTQTANPPAADPPAADPPATDLLTAGQQVQQFAAQQLAAQQGANQGTNTRNSAIQITNQDPPPPQPRGLLGGSLGGNTTGAQDQPETPRFDPIRTLFGANTPSASLLSPLDLTLFNAGINGEIENFDDPNTPEEENYALALIPEDHTSLQGAVDLLGLLGATFLHGEEMCAASDECTARLDNTRSQQTTPIPGVPAALSDQIDALDLRLVRGDYFSESFGAHPFRDSIAIIAGDDVSIPFIDALDAFLVAEDASWDFTNGTPIRTFVADPAARPQYVENLVSTVTGLIWVFIPST